jgi:hypothetical protein
MMLAKGVGIRASRKPIAEYARKPGETIGHYWYIPNVRKTGQFPHVLTDVNYWKRFVHEGFSTAAGDRGSINLFGSDGAISPGDGHCPDGGPSPGSRYRSRHHLPTRRRIPAGGSAVAGRVDGSLTLAARVCLSRRPGVA